MMVDKVLINKNIPHTMTLKGLEFLGRLAKQVPENGTIVEVGPLFGSSTWVLSHNAHPSVKIITIDTWHPQEWVKAIEAKFPGCLPFGRAAFEKYIQDCKNVQIVQGMSPEVMKGFEGPIDLFFDDATHGNPGFRDSLDFYIPKLKPGGIACGDDYASGWPDIVSEVSALGKTWNTKPEIIGRVWAMSKPDASGKSAPIYDRVGPYSDYDVAISLRTASGKEIDSATGAWAGNLHQTADPIVAIKVDWAKPTANGLSGVIQTMGADHLPGDWVPFGQWSQPNGSITAFRAHLLNQGSAELRFRYQACCIVRGRRKAFTRSTKAFSDGAWTAWQETGSRARVSGICALRCYVDE